MFARVNESKDAFLQRKRALRRLSIKDLHTSLGIQSPLKRHESYRHLYSFASQKKLFCTQAACTWIYTLEKNTTIAVIQTRKSILKYLNQKEIFEHETRHALRQDLESTKFEEMIAYQTSKNPLRRYLGPLLSTNTEQILTIFSAVISPYFYFIPLLYPMALFIRLAVRQKQLKRCQKNLEKLGYDKEVLIHLSDRQVLDFSKSRDFIKPLSLRSFQLYKYFKKF